MCDACLAAASENKSERLVRVDSQVACISRRDVKGTAPAHGEGALGRVVGHRAIRQSLHGGEWHRRHHLAVQLALHNRTICNGADNCSWSTQHPRRARLP